MRSQVPCAQLPKPVAAEPKVWEKAELAAMKEFVLLRGKPLHIWQVGGVPLGDLGGVFSKAGDRVDSSEGVPVG